MRCKTRRGLLISAAMMTVCASAPSRAQVDRTILPLARPAFDGVIADNVLDARPGTARPAQVPKGAPNILLFMADDVGFAMSSAFGGPVPTPNMEKLAAQGQRYNRFHTTGICSPSRAALLTGRNSHNAGTGFLSDMPAPFPGYGGAQQSGQLCPRPYDLVSGHVVGVPAPRRDEPADLPAVVELGVDAVELGELPVQQTLCSLARV